MSSEQQPKILSHTVVEITTYRVGMLSARTCTVHFSNRLKEVTLTGLPLPCSSGSTRKAEIGGARPFRLSTFLTLVEKHGVFGAIASQLIRNGRYEGIDRECHE